MNKKQAVRERGRREKERKGNLLDVFLAGNRFGGGLAFGAGGGDFVVWFRIRLGGKAGFAGVLENDHFLQEDSVEIEKGGYPLRFEGRRAEGLRGGLRQCFGGFRAGCRRGGR